MRRGAGAVTAGPEPGEAEREREPLLKMRSEMQKAHVLGLVLVFSASVKVSLSTQFIF